MNAPSDHDGLGIVGRGSRGGGLVRRLRVGAAEEHRGEEREDDGGSHGRKIVGDAAARKIGVSTRDVCVKRIDGSHLAQGIAFLQSSDHDIQRST